MVDSCVYLDVYTRDPVWHDWSLGVLRDAARRGKVILNAAIYGEISVGFSRIEELESTLDPLVFEYREIPREAAFLAGKCFARYRRDGGTRSSPLPDFFIGAHAAVEGLTLVTRDTKRFRRHFPGVRLVCPEGDV